MRITQELIEQARAEGMSLVGPGGLLSQVIRTVLHTALEPLRAAVTGSTTWPADFDWAGAGPVPSRPRPRPAPHRGDSPTGSPGRSDTPPQLNLSVPLDPPSRGGHRPAAARLGAEAEVGVAEVWMRLAGEPVKYHLFTLRMSYSEGGARGVRVPVAAFMQGQA